MLNDGLKIWHEAKRAWLPRHVESSADERQAETERTEEESVRQK
jgi:hypothetical protein